MTTSVQVVFAAPDRPTAAWLIQDARDRLAEGHSPDDIRLQWAGHWDAVTEAVASAEVFAVWLNISPRTIYSARGRTSTNGKPLWPEPEPGHIVGKSAVWRFAAVALTRAQMEGRGDKRAGGTP